MGIHVGIKSGGNISFVIWMNIMDRTRYGFVRHRSVSVKFKLGERRWSKEKEANFFLIYNLFQFLKGNLLCLFLLKHTYSIKLWCTKSLAIYDNNNCICTQTRALLYLLAPSLARPCTDAAHEYSAEKAFGAVANGNGGSNCAKLA